MRAVAGLHIPSVGASILLALAITHWTRGAVVWPLVGFVATATYLLVIGVQFGLASRHSDEDRGGSDPPH